jgi:hypothetical protein
MSGKTYHPWARVYPAPDLPGEWIAHCLDFDVVTQGRDPLHAMHMLLEAVCLVVSSDVRRGADPLDRRADDEDWEPLWRTVNGGQSIDIREVSLAEAERFVFATQFKLDVMMQQQELLMSEPPRTPRMERAFAHPFSQAMC